MYLFIAFLQANTTDLKIVLVVFIVLLASVLINSFVFDFLSVGSVVAGVNFKFYELLFTAVPLFSISVLSLLSDEYNSFQLAFVAPLFFLFRSVLTMAFGRMVLMSNPRWLVSNLLSIVVCHGYVFLLEKYSSSAYSSLLTNTSMAMTFLIVVIYLLNLSEHAEVDYQNQFIKYLHKKYKKKYTNLVTKEIKNVPQLKIIFFSIMIVEQINRPGIFRIFERALFFTGRIKTTGLMQVTSENILSNEESINLAQAIILEAYREAVELKLENDAVVRMVSYKYNPSEFYSDLVENTYDYIVNL
ncbi:hypothetical protein KA529_01860 [Candidatus Saccharibacteria bacterium]|nr:hypothetical protein [Candidatus Saccharibacteria bacterium]